MHLDKAVDVTTVPHVQGKVEQTIQKTMGAEITKFVECDYFTVYKWDVNDHLEQIQDKPFTLVSVIYGIGAIEEDEEKWSLKKGDHFIYKKGGKP